MAKHTKKKRQGAAPSSGESAESAGGGGLLTSMRSSFKGVAGVDGKKKRTPAQQFWDVAFWLLVLAALLLFAVGRFR